MLMTTAPTREEAAKIAKLLIEEKLAACVQLLPIESFYVWQGKTHNEAEVLLLVKTRKILFDTAITRIKTVHSYAVPEIVAVPFTAGLGDYLSWIDEVTTNGQSAT
jgi:periplasmic divalent cation tolerance protein